jgi:pyruvate,water dikinase
MQGMPLSRGVAEGPARVARTLEEAAEMRAGEILVTPFTDVGWTPYFSRAAGLATEVGSVLSHGAVVAREYGLPAIAGLPGVTRRFKTGEMLRLDGNTGELRRVRRDQAAASAGRPR